MTALFPQIDRPTRLEVKNLTMSRGGHILFEGLTTQVSSGDVLWIKGDNGIGKTTLLASLAGLARPEFGEVVWTHGEQLAQPNQLIAYQPHHSFAKGTLTAKEDLSFWAKLHGTFALVNASLTHVGLAERKNVPTQNLSAGQRRRLALAKLIVSQKPIWVLDEPTAAMDEEGCALIDDLIAKHIARGGSAIIASHDNPRKLSENTRKLTLRSAA